MTAPSCQNCRFGVLVNSYTVRCVWVTETQDEAGDRMPTWGHRILAPHRDQYGPLNRAEDCPAFEARGS